LQLALSKSKAGRIRLDRGVHDALDDFRWLADNLFDRPTRLYELVEQVPTLVGATDACGVGLGGVSFDLRTDSHPRLWRLPVPADLSEQLVSDKNRSGTITNSDLELAATVLHHECSVTHADVRERTVHTGCDNTPSVAWQRKKSVTTNSPPSYLLRLQALHQRFHRYYPVVSYLPGIVNDMADIMSRAWHLTDDEILLLFETRFPQTRSWKLWTPPPHMTSAVMSALRRKRSKPESFLRAPVLPRTTGSAGKNSAVNLASILAYKAKLNPRTPSCSSKFLPTGIGTDASPRVVSPYELALWKTPSAQLAKRLRHWGPRTLV
jgi:hypothetical protein